MIELRTLGQFRIVSEGKRAPVRMGKAAAALVYLAANEKAAVGREQLVSLLWEHSEPSRARHSLSQVIYDLRRRLPNLSLLTDGDSLVLEKTGIRIDVDEFQAAINDNRIDDAVALYMGDFLKGFWLNRAPAFEQWQDAKRQKLQQLLMRALQQQMAKAEESGNWVKAEKYAQSILERNNFNESAWRVLLTAMAASGDRIGALAEYERISMRFEAELSRPPHSDLIEFAETLKQIAPSSKKLDGDLDSDAVRVPFTGRESEFHQIRTYWDGVKRGHGRTLFIIGEAGIGKTRFCLHFLKLSSLNYTRMLRGRCYAAESRLPYGAVAEALAEGVTTNDLSKLTPAWVSAFGSLVPELMPETFSDKERPEGEGARRRLFESVARVIRCISEYQPVLLFLDDFHWADESTTEMVHYLGRRLQKCPVLILLALRSEDVNPDSRIGELLASSLTEENLARIHVNPLAENVATQLVQACANASNIEMPENAAVQIAQQTGGRPFFITEILRALEVGEIELTEPYESAAGVRPTALLPASVETILASRIRNLGDAARHVMSVLAVLGKKSNPELVRKVGRFSEGVLLPGVDELVEKQIVYDSGSFLTFTHDLIREAAYRSLSITHRRALHTRAAEVLQGREPEQPGMVAVHYDLAANPGKAFHFCLLAAAASKKVHAHNEAEFFLRMALANSPEESDHYAVEGKLADLLYQLRKFDEADAHYSNLAAYYDLVGNSSKYLSAHTRRLSIAFKKETAPFKLLADRISKSIILAEEQNNSHALNQLLLSLSAGAHASGDRDLVMSTAAQLVELSALQGSSYAGVRAITQASMIFSLWRNVPTGFQLADKGVTIATESGDDEALVVALTARANSHLQAGRITRARQDIDQAEQLTAAKAIISEAQITKNTAGIIMSQQGLYVEAEAVLNEALHLASAAEVNLELVICHCNLALVNYELSRMDVVEQIAHELVETSGDAHWFTGILGTTYLGLCALARGNITAAKKHRQEIDERAAGRDTWIVDCSYVEMFIARMSEADGESEQSIERLGHAIAAYENRDVLCRSRMRIERARLRIDLDPTAAREEASEVRQQAAEWGARPLVDKADRVLDRLALHAREGR